MYVSYSWIEWAEILLGNKSKFVLQKSILKDSTGSAGNFRW